MALYDDPFNAASRLNKVCTRCGRPYLGTVDGRCHKCIEEEKQIAEEEARKEAEKRKIWQRLH